MDIKKELNDAVTKNILKKIVKDKSMPLNKRIKAGRELRNMGVNYY